MHNIIYGFHAIISLAKNNPNAIDKIYIDNKRRDKRQENLYTVANEQNVQTVRTSDETLNKLAPNSSHQGVVALLHSTTSIESLTLEQIIDKTVNKPNAIILVLDGITDPQNLGAIIRAADCFAVDAIIIPKDNSAPSNNPIVAKTSCGAIHNIPVLTVNNLVRAIDKLKDAEFWVAGTTLHEKSINLFDFKHKQRLVWVMGSEGSGIRRLIAENCDYLVNIPMHGKTQSLNVSVATGIILAYTRFIQQ